MGGWAEGRRERWDESLEAAIFAPSQETAGGHTPLSASYMYMEKQKKKQKQHEN
jgi:hypothetical protein